MKIGTMEFIVIFLVVFFVLGPERTVLYARKLGKLLRTLKVYIGSITNDLRETVVEPLQELQEPLKDIAAPLEELTQVTQRSVNELNAATRELQKPIDWSKPTAPKATETKPDETALEFAELEMAEPELEEVQPESADDANQADPAPEAHVDADIEDAGDDESSPAENPSPAVEADAPAAALQT